MLSKAFLRALKTFSESDWFRFKMRYQSIDDFPIREKHSMESDCLLSHGAPTIFSQIETVKIVLPQNSQPSLICIDGKSIDHVSHEFPGWTDVSKLKFETLDPIDPENLHHPSRHSLNELYSSAICGNDLTSSVLYVIGVTTTMAGQLSPICLLIVGIVLYLFKFVYGEAGTAIPLNGGAYNLLLNTTSKSVASLAACLTILSYVATAVVSATESVTYAANLVPWINVYWWTIGLLGIFCMLSIVGISESAIVATGIFLVHIASLALFVITGGIYSLKNPSVFLKNLEAPLRFEWPTSLLFGFCTAMLGVTGFETSANYIEEQQKGLFPKTLHNTWLLVFIINPVLSMVCLGVLDLKTMQEHHRDLLAKTASVAGGDYFGLWISADAALVLAGAVLTAYVGVTGLVRRLAFDRCLPQILLSENQLFRTNHYIPVTFFLLCSTLFAVLDGRVRSLANVYTLAFLCVMALFAVGNIMLKYKRGRIPRSVRATWTTCFVCLGSVLVALGGNIVMKPGNLIYFLIYFLVVAGVMVLMFERARLLRYLLFLLSQGPAIFRKYFSSWAQEYLESVQNNTVVFFAKNENLEVLNKAVTYVQTNELAKWLKVVYIYSDLEDPMCMLVANNLRVIDRCHPNIAIDFVLIQGTFCPEVVAQVSQRLGVPRNFMFICCPGENFPHDLADFGGVRLITH